MHIAKNITDEKLFRREGMPESFVCGTSPISAPENTDLLGDTTYSPQSPEGMKPEDEQRRNRSYFEDDQGAEHYVYVLEAGIDRTVAVSSCLTTARFDEATTNLLVTNRD